MLHLLRKAYRHISLRGFPLSISSAYHSLHSYSQFGEDLIVQNYFGIYRSEGRYIDIGAYHPKEKSNTYLFYKKGWRGIAVEPNPEMKRLWKKHRSQDIFLGYGISSDASSNLNYHEFSDTPAQNFLSLDKKPDSGATRIQEVPCIRMDELIEHIPPSWKEIDLLDCDCEGMDLEIIRSFPFEKYRPRCIIVEDFEASSESKIERYLREQKYKKYATAHITKIFVSD